MDHDQFVIALFIGAAAIGYLLGSIPFGLVITKMAGLGDIRSIGSGNIGATNVLRTGRRDLAVATLLLDAGKAGLAFLICWQGSLLILFTQDPQTSTSLYTAISESDARSIGWIGGAFAFVGHCFPVWLKFKGGKGVATFGGLLFAGNWMLGVAFGLLWLATATIFRMSSLAALVATAATPVVGWFLNPNGDEWIVTGVIAILIWWRHSANIARIHAGTEPRIGKKKTAETPAPPGPAA